MLLARCEYPNPIPDQKRSEVVERRTRTDKQPDMRTPRDPVQPETV